MIKTPFRVGTTSYILPDEIYPNLQYLAGKIQDVELVLFEVDDGPSNLPDEAAVLAFKRLAEQAGMSFTVHLPLDLRLGDDGEEGHISMLKARRVIDCTRNLSPLAYVLHLDGKDVRRDACGAALQKWRDQAVRSLEITAGWAGDAARLAVENLEGYPLEFWEPVLQRAPVSRCVDIGHLWLDGHDPLPYLKEALPRTRVMHLHGIHQRDHQSLKYAPPEQLDRVIHYLMSAGYSGVLTLEIFNQEDFLSSLDALNASVSRFKGVRPWENI